MHLKEQIPVRINAQTLREQFPPTMASPQQIAAQIFRSRLPLAPLSMLLGGWQAVEAPREVREAIEGKTPTQPSEQPPAQSVNNVLILNSIVNKLTAEEDPQ
jgi:hypothetical protein